MTLCPLKQPGVPLPENMLEMHLSSRSWNDVAVDLATFRCDGPVVHELSDVHETRLSVLLEEVGGRCEPRLQPDQPCPIPYFPRHMTYAPAGMRVYGYGDDPRFVKDATLRFDTTALCQRLSANFDPGRVSIPRLRFADDRLYSLVRLLAQAVDDPDPSSQLYGDGLITAIAARLFSSPCTSPTPSKGLSPGLLSTVIDYLHAHLPQRIELSELSDLTGLSQSHFSREFKASTGASPYRWQLEERVRRAQTLLLRNKAATLEEVAEATGFADAVHFGRTFRKHIGTTPAAWRQSHTS